MTFNPRFILTSTGTSERWPDVPGIEKPLPASSERSWSNSCDKSWLGADK